MEILGIPFGIYFKSVLILIILYSIPSVNNDSVEIFLIILVVYLLFKLGGMAGRK